MTSFDQEYRKTVQERSDSFMKHVAAAIAEDHVKSINTVCGKDQDTGIPTELQSSLQGIVKDFEKRDQHKRRMKQIKGLGKIAAAVFICFAIVSTALIVSVEAFRTRVIDFIITDHVGYVDLNTAESGYIPNDVRDQLPEAWTDVFYPSIIPKEYSFEEAYELGSSKTLIFVNDKQELISMTYMPSGQWQTMVDSEDSQVERIQINDNSAVCFIKDNRTVIYWSQSGFEFSLIAFLPAETTKDIAENIKYVKLN